MHSRLQSNLPRQICRSRFVPSLALCGLLASGSAVSADWKSTASISAYGTLTDNVDFSPVGRRTDFITSITPTIATRLDGSRLKVQAQYSPTLNKYAVADEHDYVAQTLNASASLEAVEKFFYVDGTAQIAQTYISPFAPQPLNTTSATANRTQTTSLGLSPYIRSTTPSGVTYLLRDDNYYTSTNTSAISDSYLNQLTAKIDGPASRLLWGGDYNYTYTKFDSSQAFRSQLGRLRLGHAPTPDFTVTASGGYERNNYGVLGDERGAIYGAGFTWTPTPRTNLYANLEHRFFGPSYALGFDHRTRMTAWNIQGSRNIQSYPQQLLTLPSGNTRAAVDAIFQARITDPVERQQSVDAFIRQAGLPPVLVSPLTYYSNQIYLYEYISGSFAIIGARNTLTFGVFWNRSKPITGGGQTLPDTFLLVNQLNTVGGSVTLSHKLSALTSVAASAVRSIGRSPETSATSASIKSTQDTFLLTLSHNFSPKTYGSIGLRYQTFDSTGSSDIAEHAALAGLTHIF